MAVPLTFLKPFLKAIKDFLDSISSGIRGIFHGDDGSIPGIRPIKEVGENIGEEVGEETPEIIQEIIGEFILVAIKFI
ncbi:hypothetical protein HX833_03755 [Marine Group I thaumarchaeote]|uniref:Uncharacterized protein n=1 Tax=Marine Group I thaumarchaeote TaxID=2511932 RepID=A0A7K4NS70_9ARCH|nr:hypothetical protein [Marine Group I thaumarchaeote]